MAVDQTTFELTVIRDATYDDVAHDILSWTVTKDFTTISPVWVGVLTIRHRTTDAQLLSATVTAASATELKCTLLAADTAFALLVDDDEFGNHRYDIQMTRGVSNEVIGPYIAKIIKDVK